MESKSLISELKKIKREKNITYTAILDELTVNGSPSLSMTTLRRVFANGSESHASSFNYEQTLVPIAEAVRKISGCSDVNSKEIECLKTVISAKNEELLRTQELKDHLEASVKFLSEQASEKDALIKRLINRLDQKDEIINQLLDDIGRIKK